MNRYKDVFLKKGIMHAEGAVCLLVFLDGYLFGFLIFSLERYNRDGVYMLSDFVVRSSVPRLSKLLLLVSVSTEVRHLIRSSLVVPAQVIKTTAFTHKPVSMKYRGVYKLSKRGDGFLNYEAGPAPCPLRRRWPGGLKRYAR